MFDSKDHPRHLATVTKSTFRVYGKTNTRTNPHETTLELLGKPLIKAPATKF